MKREAHVIGSNWLLLKVIAALVIVLGFSSAGMAQNFPDRPVRIIVGFAPGGTTDILARIVGEKLSSIWGQPVIIENRPGADGIIATTAVAAAEPNGYTILMSTNAITITPHLKTLPYDPIKDFEPITIVGREYHHLMVTPSLPAKTVQEFVKLAKDSPGKLNFSSAGPGSAPFLAMERFKQVAGLDLVHIPFPGSAPAVTALASGDVQAMFSSPSTTLQIALSGKVRLIGVSGPQRDKNVPDTPTLSESGYPGFATDTWFGLMAPAKLPPAVLAKIRADAVEALKSPDAREKIEKTGSTVVGNNPEEFREIIKNDTALYGDVIRRVKN
jgi:tripartite-type tricarboxylate transporter receptor subunit TctC